MTLPYRGGAKLPGPLGVLSGKLGGRVPGPLGFGQVDLAKGGATRAAKTLDMPEPWHSFTSMRVGISALKLADGAPKVDDVKQGGLPNCPLAAVLAALAFTPVGAKHLDGMVTEYTGTTVRTKLPDEVLDRLKPEYDSQEHPQDTKLESKRYFTVKLKEPDQGEQIGKGKTVEVHDTFYFKYDDTALTDFVFMQAPNSVLWPAVIEKACAVHYGSYNEMGNYHKHKANEFWELVIRKKPEGGFEIKSSTDLASIRAVAEKAKAVPALAASRPAPAVLTSVTPEHGFAVLGVQSSGITLYDPAKAARVTLSLEDFRKAFQVILYGSP